MSRGLEDIAGPVAGGGTPAGVPGGRSLDDVIESFHGVRSAMADLLTASGADPTKTRESARVLGLNRGLAWRVSRLIRSDDFAAAVSDVPGRASMEKVISACGDRGAPTSMVTTARRAIEAFEGAVDRCSGDRKTLAMLMANRDERTANIEQERARRKLFEGACAVWGVQAQARFVTVFLFPARDDPTKLDIAHATGYVGFRRLREIPWPMSYESVQSKEGEARTFEKQPLDPEGSSEGELQLITRFCTPERPAINVEQAGALKRFELAAGPVGNEGLTTCVFGTYLRHLFLRSKSPEDDFATFYVQLETPVERVIFDTFVHRDLRTNPVPEAVLCDRLTSRHVAKEADIEREAMPIGERAFPLGAGAAGTLTAHIPWYTRLISFIGERIGVGVEEFHGSRFEMRYPPIPTALARRMELED